MRPSLCRSCFQGRAPRLPTRLVKASIQAVRHGVSSALSYLLLMVCPPSCIESGIEAWLCHKERAFVSKTSSKDSRSLFTRCWAPTVTGARQSSQSQIEEGQHRCMQYKRQVVQGFTRQSTGPTAGWRQVCGEAAVLEWEVQACNLPSPTRVASGGKSTSVWSHMTTQSFQA